MAFFNIFKMNFLKPYYRTFSPNKGINFTLIIQLKRIFLRRVGSNALGHSNPIKSLSLGTQSQNQTLPNFNFFNH
ncbi:hypothetical protein HMPREF1403_01572 [Helicobacter pylori GAM201Ai]|nr:hypothetical protein HMPREF1403_01572 [Helicobacter pylori GAM201Ai]